MRAAGDVGPHFLIYTFNPDLRVINAFLQSIIGLYDFAQLTGDPRAQSLYETGEAEARVETPRYNTGAWSLYSLSRESDLSYHKLVRDFLKRLCDRVGAPVYCDTAQAFTDQLSVDPTVAPVTRRIRGGKPAQLKFRLSKISRVGVTRARRERQGRVRHQRGGRLRHQFFTWSTPPLKGGDGYTLRASAVDLAGNRGATTSGPLRILKGKKPKKPRSDEASPPSRPSHRSSSRRSRDGPRPSRAAARAPSRSPQGRSGGR